MSICRGGFSHDCGTDNIYQRFYCGWSFHTYRCIVHPSQPNHTKKNTEKKNTKGLVFTRAEFIWIQHATCQDLDVAGVQHDADGSSHGASGEVLGELSADNSRVSVSASDLSPDDAEDLVVSVSALLSAVGSVDVSDALSEVELSVLAVLNTVETKERDSHGLVAVGALETDEGSLGIKAVESK